jgi:5'-3' exonuclease
MNTKLLIDGDVLVYRMGFASQSQENGPEPISHAVHLVKKTVGDMCKKFNTDNAKVFLTSNDKSNFRFEIAKTLPYKGNRDKKYNPKAAEKPFHYNTLRRYILSNYNSVEIYGQEADDAMAIAQMAYIDDPYFETVICTIDKDLHQVPGKHYNFVTEKLFTATDPGELELVESEDKKGAKKYKIKGFGCKWFYAQMLLGDSADNIPGLKGFGPVKVFNILNKFNTEKDLYDKVKGLYLDRLEDEMTEEDICNRVYEVADLLWMRRKEGEMKSDWLKSL